LVHGERPGWISASKASSISEARNALFAAVLEAVESDLKHERRVASFTMCERLLET
jgi:hypothetical protein